MREPLLARLRRREFRPSGDHGDRVGGKHGVTAVAIRPGHRGLVAPTLARDPARTWAVSIWLVQRPMSTVATAFPVKFVTARSSELNRSIPTITPTPLTRSGRQVPRPQASVASPAPATPAATFEAMIMRARRVNKWPVGTVNPTTDFETPRCSILGIRQRCAASEDEVPTESRYSHPSTSSG